MLPDISNKLMEARFVGSRHEAVMRVEADRRRHLLLDACDDDGRLELSFGVRPHI